VKSQIFNKMTKLQQPYFSL